MLALIIGQIWHDMVIRLPEGSTLQGGRICCCRLHGSHACCQRLHIQVHKSSAWRFVVTACLGITQWQQLQRALSGSWRTRQKWLAGWLSIRQSTGNHVYCSHACSSDLNDLVLAEAQGVVSVPQPLGVCIWQPPHCCRVSGTRGLWAAAGATVCRAICNGLLSCHCQMQ